MADIAVLGSGGWGTALAVALCARHTVSLWSPFSEEVAALRRDRAQPKLLPGITLDPAIRITDDLGCVRQADMAIIATPSFAVRETAARLRGVAPEGVVIVNVAKGIEDESLLRLSQVIEQELPGMQVASLSGPSHAEEVAKFVPTSLVAASRDRRCAEFVQGLISSPALRVYTNDDVVGVELGGALKNIIALAAGISDGLGLGDNTKAALMTRGLSEIARLGVQLGARQETFAGLTGIGDLVVTCTSMHSRNRRFGILVGEGVPPQEALSRVGMTVEGYHAVKTARRLAMSCGVEMPITEQCYRVLYEGASARDAIRNLMGRPRKHEQEHPWIE